MTLSVAWPRLFLVVLSLTAMLALSARAEAQTAPDPVFTAATSTVLDPPHPVLGTDGRRHLVYEVRIVNTSPLRVRFDRVVVRGASSARVFKAVAGRAIAGILSTPLRPATRMLGPAQAGVLWLDVALRRTTRVPRRLVHRLVTTVSGRGFRKRVIAWRGARTKVARGGPVVVSPPLRGSGYYDGNGCCGAGPHTRALLSIGGLPFLAQRFAIDWVRFDARGRWVVGDPAKNENYVVFGDPIYAVARGRVVSVLTTLP